MKKRALIVAVAVVCLVGCKAEPIATTSFFGTTQGLVKVEEIETFHQLWANPTTDWNKYKKIMFPQVDTHHLRNMDWWQETSMAGHDEQGIQELARFMRSEFIKAQSQNTNPNRLQVVNVPDGETLIMELAITEVVPTKAWLNAASFVGAMMTVDKGSVAMEGLVRDGATREVVAKFADKEQGKDSVFNVKDFGWHGHAKSIITEWATQILEITNTPEGTAIEDSGTFEWKFW